MNTLKIGPPHLSDVPTLPWEIQISHLGCFLEHSVVRGIVFWGCPSVLARVA